MGKNGKQLDLERVSLTLPPGDVPRPGTTWTQPQTSQMRAIIPPNNPMRYSHHLPLCELYLGPVKPNSAFFSACHTAYRT